MNHNAVHTFVAAVALTAHSIVKFTTYTGLSRGQQSLTNALAVTPSAATDAVGLVAIGTVLQDVEAGGPADVFLFNAGGTHYVTAGNGTAIAPGDSLDMGASGTLVKHVAGTVVAVATSASDGSGCIFNALFA